jgi:ubiquinone/menaquinone biosynthesis C-methylase UbiE
MADDARRETYVHGYSDECSGSMATGRRSPMPPFRPQLPGMRLLDAGCGPGSITVDLAEFVAPGEVVGLDIAEEQLAVARALATRRGVANVRFERGDLYALPYPDASFDTGFAHNVLEHLRDRRRAARVRRVLRPGGGRSDNDAGTISRAIHPLRQRMVEPTRVAAHNGASFFYARHQRHLLREAGFVRTEGHGVAEVFGTPEKTRLFAAALAKNFREPALVATVLEQGWADRAELEAIAADIEAWGEDPDAYWAIMNPAALGWAGEDRAASRRRPGGLAGAGQPPDQPCVLLCFGRAAGLGAPASCAGAEAAQRHSTGDALGSVGPRHRSPAGAGRASVARTSGRSPAASSA